MIGFRPPKPVRPVTQCRRRPCRRQRICQSKGGGGLTLDVLDRTVSSVDIDVVGAVLLGIIMEANLFETTGPTVVLQAAA